MIALPRDWAWDFLLLPSATPKPCPVLDVVEAGAYRTVLAEGADLRSDIPRYRVWRDGRLAEEVGDATPLWQEHPDLVTFLIGCSFTFETPLQEAGIPRYATCTDGCNVPMYRSITGPAARPAACMARWWCPCVPSRAPRGRCGVHLRPAFRPCTVRPCTWATRRRWASPILPSPTSVTPCASRLAKCPCSGPAASRRRLAVMASGVPLRCHARAGLHVHHRRDWDHVSVVP